MRHTWWLPIRLGIPLAVIAGGVACWSTRSELHFLLVNHLFRTAGLQTVAPLNRAAAIVVPALFLIVLIFSLTRFLARRAAALIRLGMLGALLAAGAVAAHLHGHDVPACSAVQRALAFLFPHKYLSNYLLGGAGVLLLLAVGWRRGWRALRLAGHVLARPARAAGLLGLRAANLLGLLLLLGFIAINLATGLLCLRTAATREKPPNVILIMVDTLRADHVGCYGYRRNTTPNIDRFARESTLFSKAVAQAPWTLWSVYSFLTSTYSDGVRFDVDAAALRRRHGPPLLAEILRNQGYSTHAVLGNPVFGFFPIFRQGFESYNALPDIDLQGISSPAVTAAAEQRLQRLSKEQPFFFYIVYFDPHAPYYSHSGFTFSETQPGPRPVQLSHAPNHTMQTPAGCRTATVQRDTYDSEIAFTDAEVGKLLAALKTQGLYEDSLIILFSDHGEEFREHGQMGHMYTLYNETLDVPLLVKLPGQRAGAVVDGDFPLLDLSPSILGMCQSKTSAFRILGDDAGFEHLQRCARKPIYSSTVDGVFSVRDERNTFIVNALSGKVELYDVVKDPWEQRNLAPGHSDLIVQWRNTLRGRSGSAPVVSTVQSDKAIDTSSMSKDTLDRLHSLGYLQQ